MTTMKDGVESVTRKDCYNVVEAHCYDGSLDET